MAPSELEPIYSFSEAAMLIPSERGGTVSVATLHRWRRLGLLTAICRKTLKRDSYFLSHSEVIRLRGEVVEPAPIESQLRRPSSAQRQREIEEAVRRAEGL